MTFLDTMMNCASSEIGPTTFWPRAETALRVAASAERRWSTIVSRAAKKLQTPDGGIGDRDATALAGYGRALNDPDTLARWCEIATRDAVYITALCRIHRKARKANARAARPTAPTLDTEAPF